MRGVPIYDKKAKMSIFEFILAQRAQLSHPFRDLSADLPLTLWKTSFAVRLLRSNQKWKWK